MNTRTLTMAGVGLAVISGIVLASLWLELRSARETTAALQTKQDAARGMPQSAGTGTGLPAAVVEGFASSGNIASTPEPAASLVSAPGANAPALVQAAHISEQDLMKDPEYRKARLGMLRTSLRRVYPGLADALHLTPEEADRFFSIVADTEMTRAEQAMANASAEQPLSEAAMADVWRNREAFQRKQADALRELLGPARYEQWLDYLPTRTSRMQAASLAAVADDAGVPLDMAQQQAFESAVAAEEKSLKQDIVALGRTVDTSNPLSQAQAQAALKKRQAQSSQRILDATAPYLSAKQVSALRANIEEQAIITRAMDAARQRAKETRLSQQSQASP